MKEIASTVKNWEEEILNYFDCRITNAKTERKIGTFKRLQHARILV